jgi:hypothetical protein
VALHRGKAPAPIEWEAGWAPKPGLNILEQRHKTKEGVRVVKHGKTYLKYPRLRRYAEIFDVFKIQGFTECTCRPGSSVSIVTDYGLDGPGIESRWVEIFRICPDRLWGPPSLSYIGCRVFPGGKVRPGRDVDHSPPSSAEVLEE